MLLLLAVGLAGAIYWTVKNKQSNQTPDQKRKNIVAKQKELAELIKSEEKGNKQRRTNNSEVDAEKELEWYRKNSNAVGRTKTANLDKTLTNNSKVSNNNKRVISKQKVEHISNESILFEKLPISSFVELTPAENFDDLPLSNDPAVVSAIEQTQDEYEEDVDVRELAVRILTQFRNRNSVEALSQVALYDLSAHLRSKAVMVLADFDHESTFETILLACADPTREVRAAAAKALFSLSYDRGNAWKRIVDTQDDYRINQSARAAIESDLVERSIDRLVHPDEKYSYEAFALVALLIRAGETREIFNALENHRDKQVKLAILHVIKIVGDERTISPLYHFVEKNSLPEDLGNSANEVIRSFGLVSV